MSLWLALGDCLALLVSASVVLIGWSSVNPTLNIFLYTDLLPLVIVFLLAYLIVGLYPAIGINDVEEMRRLTMTTTVCYLMLATLSFYFRNMDMWSRASFALSWVLAIGFIPVTRFVMRYIACRFGLWGEPVAIIGFGSKGLHVYKLLMKNQQLGLKPRVIYSDSSQGLEEIRKDVACLPLKNILDLSQNGGTFPGTTSAIVVSEEMTSSQLEKIINGRLLNFKHVIILPKEHSIGSTWITPIDLEGVLGLEVRQNLLSATQRFLKKILDIGLIVTTAPFLLVIIPILSILIKIDSPGSIFYHHKRIGQNGRIISVVKFRTMVKDADQVLENYFQHNPSLKSEWENSAKLREDPRVTRMGYFLRRMSLDELPQALNVLRGEMSFIGPRPIVQKEVSQYKNAYNLYLQVQPGITGLWQVSGRNDLSYAERVRLDEYYVRNWSIWLDIYILVKTFATVVGGKGAY